MSTRISLLLLLLSCAEGDTTRQKPDAGPALRFTRNVDSWCMTKEQRLRNTRCHLMSSDLDEPAWGKR